MDISLHILARYMFIYTRLNYCYNYEYTNFSEIPHYAFWVGLQYWSGFVHLMEFENCNHHIDI